MSRDERDERYDQDEVIPRVRWLCSMSPTERTSYLIGNRFYAAVICSLEGGRPTQSWVFREVET